MSLDRPALEIKDIAAPHCPVTKRPPAVQFCFQMSMDWPEKGPTRLYLPELRALAACGGASGAGKGARTLCRRRCARAAGTKTPLPARAPRHSPKRGPGKGVGTLWRARTRCGAEASGTRALPLQCWDQPLPPCPHVAVVTGLGASVGAVPDGWGAAIGTPR